MPWARARYSDEDVDDEEDNADILTTT